MKRVISLIMLHSIVATNGFLDRYSKVSDIPLEHEDPGSPLFLTPYIDSGNISEARRLARVRLPDFPYLKSFAGFLTVDKTYDSNQFFWYFKSHLERSGGKLIIRLQGGPGTSSLFGVFDELGPLKVVNNAIRRRKNFIGDADSHLLFIDNPVGTGFSFTNDSRGYCTNQTQIGEHLYTTMVQFYQLFPRLLNAKLYIYGESYAAKYVAALAHTIHKRNPSAKTKINIHGLIIGSGWCDPINQVSNYTEYLYELGLMDWVWKPKAEQYERQIIELIKKEAWRDAYNTWLDTMAYLQGAIGTVSLYNYLQESNAMLPKCDFCELIQSAPVREAIHVGSLPFNDGKLVFHHLIEDLMQSVAPWLSELLDNYRVLIYNGLMDIFVPHVSVNNYLRKLKFNQSVEFEHSLNYISLLLNATITYAELTAMGYVRFAKNLEVHMINNAGHLVAQDQTEWLNDMIVNWIWTDPNT